VVSARQHKKITSRDSDYPQLAVSMQSSPSEVTDRLLNIEVIMATTETTSSSSGGIGFVGLLTIVFIALKLTGYIDWPWIWVLSPIWIACGIVFGIILIVLLVVIMFKSINYITTR